MRVLLSCFRKRMSGSGSKKVLRGKDILADIHVHVRPHFQVVVVGVVSVCDASAPTRQVIFTEAKVEELTEIPEDRRVPR